MQRPDNVSLVVVGARASLLVNTIEFVLWTEVDGTGRLNEHLAIVIVYMTTIKVITLVSRLAARNLFLQS